ncbi:hypothetical protein [Petrachloros mirabilis]
MGQVGQTDGDEVATGTDPADPESVFKLSSVAVYFPVGEPQLWIIWTSVEGKSYQLYYSDSEFGDSMIWSPLGDPLPGSGSIIGVPDEGDAGTGRKSPFDPTLKERYYEVEVVGTGIYTRDTGGIYWITLRNSAFSGMNCVSTPFIPYSNTLDEVLNIQLTGSTVPQFADQCWKWNQSTLSYEKAFFNGTQWRDFYNPSNPPTFTFDADIGYRLVLVPTTPDNKRVYFTGKVSDTSRSISLTKNPYSGLNEVGSAYPIQVSLENSGFVESGFTGSTVFPFSDQLWFWNWTTLSYERIYYNTAASEWRDYPAETVTTKQLTPGEGLRVILSPVSSFSTWNYPKRYTQPPN